MDNRIKHFEVSSPDELRKALTDFKNGGECFADVRVSGANILTRQFSFPNASKNDLIAGLKLEASEILSVTAGDVEVSYKITGTEGQGVHGIYIAIPRHLLSEYLDCFKSCQLIPVSLTASVVGAVIDFLKDQPLPGDNFCLVNFLKPHAVSIIIFANAKPSFFRELYDLNDSDYKGKITDTIRYCSSLSANKKIDQIFFIGDLNGKDVLIKSLKELGNFSLNKPAPTVADKQIDFTSLNLFENFVCGIEERTKLVFIFTLIAVVSVVLTLSLAWNFTSGHSKLHEANLKLNMNDYYRALDLQEKVRRMNHE